MTKSLHAVLQRCEPTQQGHVVLNVPAEDQEGADVVVTVLTTAMATPKPPVQHLKTRSAWRNVNQRSPVKPINLRCIGIMTSAVQV
jgi:hypothetical protein